MPNPVEEELSPGRLTEVVAIGVSSAGREPGYQPLSAAGRCRVTAFEPDPAELRKLREAHNLGHRYLPYAIGDGRRRTLNIGPWRYSLDEPRQPESARVEFFHSAEPLSEISRSLTVQTRRLDDVAEIDHIDLCQLNVQGGELGLLQAAAGKLAEAVVVQIEWPFISLYRDQATLGEIDVELRRQGFMPFRPLDIRPWPLTGYGLRGGANPLRNPLQIMAADVVYVRDLTCPELLSDEQLKQMALIARECYGSIDLALYCAQLLKDRSASPDTARRYGEPGVTARARSPEQPSELTAGPAGDIAPPQPRWPDVQHARLTLWQDNPSDVDPLYQLARDYRLEGRYQLGYLFAEGAFAMSQPGPSSADAVPNQRWQLLDELAVCAGRTGRRKEAFTLYRRLLARTDLPDADRLRIAGNRDLSVPVQIETTSAYPAEIIDGLRGGTAAAPVTVSFVAGADRDVIEQTVNSFLNTCTDLSAVGRFVILNAELSAADRRALGRRYGFAEFIRCQPGDAGHLQQLQRHIGTPFWLHVESGWTFFSPEDLIGRLIAVLEAEPDVVQVGVNFGDATEPTGRTPTGDVVRRAAGTGRYVLTKTLARGPAIFDMARLEEAGGVDAVVGDGAAQPARSARRYDAPAATLDLVLCRRG